MAITKTTEITKVGSLVIDFDADSSVEAHVTGNSSGKLYVVDIDNTANASSSAYLRIKDAQSAGSAGTLVPWWLFVAGPGAKASYVLSEGHSYSTGLTLWCTTSNAPENTSSPSASVIVKLIAT